MKRKYFTIGVVAQAVTLIERALRGKVKEGYKIAKDGGCPTILFLILLILGCLGNVIVWPYSIACELINIKNDR
jgi:hypothetical protein